MPVGFAGSESQVMSYDGPLKVLNYEPNQIKGKPI